MPCPVQSLRVVPHTMPGTELAYCTATPCPVLSQRILLFSYAPPTRCPVLSWRMVLPATAITPLSYPLRSTSGMVLRACYAKSGTDLRYAAASLRASAGPAAQAALTIMDEIRAAVYGGGGGIHIGDGDIYSSAASL
eukprot:3316526-Rhodomonas_salina.1